MLDFNMVKYLSSLISIGYLSILNNKIDFFFNSKKIPNKVTSLEIHLIQIHLHIVLILLLK
jgi:hypothetical protein